MQYFVGLDVGGTNTKAVLLNERKKVLASIAMPTPTKKGKKAAVQNILKAIQAISKGKKIAAIGIGAAGAVDEKNSMLENAPNLRVMEKVPIKKIVAREFRVPVVVENDANTAALAESKLGAGKKAKIMVLLTLGTGLGSGIVVDGKLFVGSTHAAAQFGHTIIDRNGYKCACGNNGCFEAMASAPFIKRRAKELARKRKTVLKKFDPISVEIAAKCGDAVAKQTYRELAENLGIGMANICNILNPDIIVLVGGIAKAKSIYPIAIKKMKQLAFKQSTEHVKVCQTKLGYFAGAIGAALVAMEK